MKKYVFREYSNKYPQLFNKEKQKLRKIIPKNARIEHVGSSAIPGVGGKGIIDILIAVKKEQLKKVRGILLNNNYLLMHNAPSRISFQKDYGIWFLKRRVHIHLTTPRSKTWNEHTIFKKNLLNNKKIREEYIKLKKKAVEKAKGTGKIYKAYKNKFIKKYSKHYESRNP